MLCMGIGISVLIGWSFDIDVLKSWNSSLIHTKANMAVSLVLAGVALWTLREGPHSRARGYLGYFCASLVLLIAVLTISETLFHRDLRIDQIFFTEPAHTAGGLSAARMGTSGAICLMLAGCSLLLLDVRGSFDHRWRQLSDLFVAVVSMSALWGFILGYRPLYAYSSNLWMSLPAAIGLFTLSIGMLVARPLLGWARIISEDAPGSVILRRLVPASVLVPLALTWLRLYGQRAGLYGTEVGAMLLGVTMIASLILIMYITVKPLNQVYARGKNADILIASILESSTEYSIIGKHLDGKILLWNEGARRIYGYEPEEVVEKANSSILHIPEDVARDNPRAMREAASRDGKWEGTIQRRRKNGQQFTARVVMTPRLDSAGKVAGFLLISKDVSDEIRLTEELKATQLYTRSLFESNMDAMVATDTLGVITDVNRQMGVLTGFPRKELIGQPFKNFFTDPGRAEQGIQLVLKKGQVLDYELTANAKDGHTTVVSFNGSTFRDAAGKLQGVFAAARDITERKWATAALLESEQRYRSLALATTQVVWTASVQGEMAGDVSMWCNFTGQSPEAARGRGWIDAVHPEDRDRTLTVWSAAVKERTSYDTEYRLRRHDGEYRNVAVRGVPVSQNGTIQEWIGTCTDITGRKLVEKERAAIAQKIFHLNEELERKVNHRTVELNASNQELEAFAYSVSHDLRAPLRHIEGFLNLLKKRCYAQLDAAGQRYIDNTTDASRRLGTLIDELLQFSRLGRSEIRKQHVDLKELIAAVQQELEPESQNRVVRWQVDDLPAVEADQVMLRQILENLLANALKFTRTRPEAEIVISSRCEPDGQVVISVRDNGVGFSMDYSDKLFQVFQRLHQEDEFEGTGIGLANVRRMVERHGGRVWAEGAVDQGATFYFSLPSNGATTGEKHELTEAHSVS